MAGYAKMSDEWTLAQTTHYLIAAGSNQYHQQYGKPRSIISAALDWISIRGIQVIARSKMIPSAPLGPSQRSYANGAAIVASALKPHAMLELLHSTENMFGRVRRGERWRARMLDLDIILWSGGVIAEADLTIPHPEFRNRGFVLAPAASIAPDWRDPITGLSVQQLNARLTKPRPVRSGRLR